MDFSDYTLIAVSAFMVISSSAIIIGIYCRRRQPEIPPAYTVTDWS